jgi:NhaP-type Na+/H+ or K+/H+ antiporter/mannitol/fructose-specific phosphotransferase system IIA component (Ntr-type)
MMVFAHKLRVSAIVLLLFAGVIAGPEFLGLIQPASLGDGLRTIISLAVGIILFEGGLTLDIRGYRRNSREISRLLSIGVLLTWLVTALLVRFCFGFPLSFSLLASSLIIVTGPTVIGPLLKRIRLQKRLHHILHWESVLIDPIGVFVALLCYEWILSEGGGLTYLLFIGRFLVGSLIGACFGALIFIILKRSWIPAGLLNITVLAFAMLCLGTSESLLPESGLLAVTTAGFLVGYWKPEQLERLIAYKDELKDYLIGLLFILLSSQLQLARFQAFGDTLIWVVAVIMFVIRPLNIFISTRGSDLRLREKVFLSWVAPRGIVAASVASLFAYRLGELGSPHAPFLEALTYSVIVGTVVLQGFTAKPVGALLRVLEPTAKDWLIIGAGPVPRKVAHYLRQNALSVVLLDTNAQEVRQARAEGFAALHENALTFEPEQHTSLQAVGSVVAITENQDLNLLVCQRINRLMPQAQLFRWAGTEPKAPEDLRSGKRIWANFPLKVAAADEAAGLEIHRSTSPPEGTQLLLSGSGSDVQFQALPSTKGSTWLAYRPAKNEAILPLSESGLFFSSAENLEELFGELAQRAGQHESQLEPDQLRQQLIAGEREFSSLIGQGICLPHLYSRAIERPLVLLAKPRQPLACLHSGEVVDLVFLLISQEKEPALHLELLSRVARIVVQDGFRQAAGAAENEAALLVALRRAEAHDAAHG